MSKEPKQYAKPFRNTDNDTSLEGTVKLVNKRLEPWMKEKAEHLRKVTSQVQTLTNDLVRTAEMRQCIARILDTEPNNETEKERMRYLSAQIKKIRAKLVELATKDI